MVRQRPVIRAESRRHKTLNLIFFLVIIDRRVLQWLREVDERKAELSQPIRLNGLNIINQICFTFPYRQSFDICFSSLDSSQHLVVDNVFWGRRIQYRRWVKVYDGI